MFALLFALLLAPPDDAGFDRAKLDALRDRLAARRTDSLLILRRGRIAYEWYAPDWNAAKPHGAASLSKSLVGGLSLLIALSDGKVAPDDPASKWIPAWRSDPRKSLITLRQLATHSSGLEDAEQNGLPHDKLTGWKGAFWRRDPDPFSIALKDAPVLFPSRRLLALQQSRLRRPRLCRHRRIRPGSSHAPQHSHLRAPRPRSRRMVHRLQPRL